jgi:NAD(P)-dependent dehydrogenase (short-subunit alcohol dehydrogenase family)
MRLDGKSAVVTGAARGLGRAYALRLASLGADVAVVDIDLNAAAEFNETLSAPSVSDEIRALGRKSIGLQGDLTKRHEVERIFAAVIAEFGRIDVLVNNAGGALTPIERSTASVAPDEDIAKNLDVNLMSAMYCCQTVAPTMKAQGGGVIVNIATMAALTVIGRGLLAHYGVAKAAVVQYTRYLAAELGPDGIRANCLSPGPIQTSRVVAQAAARGIVRPDDARRIPLRRLGTTEDCCNVLEFLATDLSSYVTGQCISVCGGSVLSPS